MSVKIQLNSLEALERLIGGDSEIEVSIRANIASEFAGKYLRPLINSPELRTATDLIKMAAQAEATKQISELVGSIKRGTYGGQTLTLNEDFKSEIKRRAKAEVDAQINELVNYRALVDEAIAKYSPENIQARIDTRVESVIEERINAGVKAKLAKIASNIS